MPKKVLSLAEFVNEVADELRELRDAPPAAGGPVIKFRECVVEAAVDITVDAKGGVKFWVIEAGAGAARKASHKVSVKFDAIGEIKTD